MQLTTPAAGLLVWTILILVLSLVLPIVAIIRLGKSKQITQLAKIGWIGIIVCAPIFGSIISLLANRKKAAVTNNY